MPLDSRAPIFWEGRIEPVAGASLLLTGPAAMVANPNDTRATVAVQALEEGLVLSWLVRRGGCESEGARIAPLETFPTLRRSSSDMWTADALIFRRIDPVGTFAAEIYSGEDASGELLACADLLQTDSPDIN